MRRAGVVLQHDVSVPTADVAIFIRRTHAAIESLYPTGRCVPFGHLGDGNIHFSIIEPIGLEKDVFYRSEHVLTPIVFDTAVSMSGSFRAEHGVGMLKLDELDKYKHPTDLELMRKIKKALDPRNLVNPGKVVRFSD